MADNNLSTGKSQLNSQLLAGAANLAQPAAQLAMGASKIDVATGLLQDAFMDKLLGPAAAFTGLLSGSLLVLRKVVRESQILEKGLTKISNLQQIEGKFETLLKSATLAKQRIKELYDFTKNSPFKFEDVAEANRQLEALTYGAFSGTKAMQMVGDAAAATGQSMTEMAGRVGKLYAALASGRSIDKIAFQLQFTGLATEGLIGKLESLEAAGAGLSEMWREVEKVMANTTGGMENEMQTLESLNAKLEESRSVMEKAFAEPFVEAQSNAIRTMTKATENLTPVLAQVGQDIAVVRGAFVDFKTGLMDVTLASPGMATALEAAWAAAKTLWVSLAALTVGLAVKNVGAFLSAAAASVATAKSYLATAAAGATLTRSVAANNTMLEKWAEAGAAASEGSYGLALSLAFQAAQAKVAVYALAIHEAGMEAYRASTGASAAINYVFAASNTVVAGSLKGVGMALRFVKTQIVSTVAALGLVGAAVTVVVGLGLATFGWYRRLQQVRKEYAELSQATTEAAAKVKELFDAAKNTDDWAKAVAAATENLAKMSVELDDLLAKRANKGWLAKLLGEHFYGAETLEKGRVQELQNQIAMGRAQRANSINKLPFMGMGTKQSEAYARDLQTAQAVSDTALENRLQIADDQARVDLLEKEADRLYKIAEAARVARSVMEAFNTSTAKLTADNNLSDAQDAKSRADKAMSDAGVDASAPRLVQFRAASALLGNGGPGGAKAVEQNAAQLQAINQSIAAEAELKAAEEAVAQQRRESTSELVVLDQKIRDEQAKGTEQSKLTVIELQKQRLILLDQIKNADQLAAAAKQRENDAQRARDARDVSRAGAAVDPAILVATAQGNEALVAELQMKRQLAQLEEQIAQATRDRNDELAEALTLQAAMVIATKAAADAKFARDRKVERDANAALIRGDTKGAQAIRDAAALREMEQDYAKNGMSPEQAKADFQQNILAQAAGQAPSIVADSKQAIGGGGSAFQGRDPVLRAQERIARLNEQIRDGIVEMNAKLED